jgi:hypothetical protein
MIPCLWRIPSVREAREIKRVLDEFMEAYGMSINQDKSHLFFFNTQSQSSSTFLELWALERAPFHPNI